MNRRRLDLEHLERHAQAHAAAWDELDLASPVDRGAFFLCPTQTPLYYTEIYGRLEDRHVLRYNQLTGLSFNEVISFFESHLARPMLDALTRRRGSLPGDLVAALRRFAEEEARHTAAFRALNRLCEPSWYAETHQVIVRTPAPVLWALHAMARRPALFPAMVWLALVMEEKSLATSRALIRAGEDQVEGHFLGVYRAHLQDEARHVQLDWHMLDHLYEGRPRWLRAANARLFTSLLTRFFLTPDRAGRRVVEILLEEHPELRPLAPELNRQLAALGDDPAYHEMMYSRASTPITFALMDRCREFRHLGKELLSYPRGRLEETP